MKVNEWIKKHEGFSSHPYLCTSGKVTIGFGRNLDERGISVAEAELLLANDIRNSDQELSPYMWYERQPLSVRNALINMHYNLGLTRLLTFKKMIAALAAKDYTKAAAEALDSKWAKQVGSRATDIALVIREGANGE